MTNELPAGYRPANENDAAEMAELVNMAGEGMPLYLWSNMASGDQSPWEVGRERARRESGGFSFRNSTVREEAGKAVALLVGYPLDDDPEAIDYSGMPPMFVPLQQLEDLAPATWYINVLAAYPEQRGRGFGSELLAIAEAKAIASGKRGLSLVVSDSNTGARRLYERQGYREAAQRPMVKEDFEHPGENWVLLLKDL